MHGRGPRRGTPPSQPDATVPAPSAALILRDDAPDPRHRLGLEGEARAERALRQAGLRVLDRRFRTRRGELDLVALDGDVIVFVEVKTRTGEGTGAPAESVTRVKQERLARTALAWLQRRGWLDRRCRFDVVEVLLDARGGVRLRHLRDAFRL